MTEVIYSLDINEYHASRHLSAHKLADFAARGPRYFAMRHLRKSLPPKPQTDAMRFGQLFEDAIQGVQVDWEKYAVKPEGMKFNNKEGQTWRDDPVRAGKQIITQEELDDLKWMTESVAECELALDMIKQCNAQVSMRHDGACTFGLQSRPDWVAKDLSFSLDLKTCESLNMIASGKSVREYRYHCQAAIAGQLMHGAKYADAPAPECYLLAVEKMAPYRCQVIRFTSDWLIAGKRWCDEQIAGIEQCIERGSWPRVEEQCVDLAPPPAWL